MSFLNKVVIVTGSSSGIGSSTALQFAKEGAYVTIVGRNDDSLKQVADKISQVGKPALVVKADVTKDEEAKEIIQKTIDKFGKIDVLINNAGAARFVNVGDKNFLEAFDFGLKINLRAAVLLTHFAVPYLKKTKGNIINISTVASKTIFAHGRAPYSAPKAGLDHFTKICAMELAEFGVRVNTVTPGPANTSFLKKAGVEDVDLTGLADKLTALKTLIEPSEISNAILFLASNKAKSITGSDYEIDAGFLVNGRM